MQVLILFLVVLLRIRVLPKEIGKNYGQTLNRQLNLAPKQSPAGNYSLPSFTRWDTISDFAITLWARTIRRTSKNKPRFLVKRSWLKVVRSWSTPIGLKIV